jgi:hypothetical protein
MTMKTNRYTAWIVAPTSSVTNAKILYRGNSESIMYSHVTAVEFTLSACHATADIEIIDNGESRYLNYVGGRRIDIP